MSESIKLGDMRILEEQEPDLAKRLFGKIDLDNPAFHSQEFSAALKDTRRGVFDTLINFLISIEITDEMLRETFANVATNGASLWPHIAMYPRLVASHPKRALPNEIVKAAVIADLEKRPAGPSSKFGADHILLMPVHRELWQDPEVQTAFNRRLMRAKRGEDSTLLKLKAELDGQLGAKEKEEAEALPPRVDSQEVSATIDDIRRNLGETLGRVGITLDWTD